MPKPSFLLPFDENVPYFFAQESQGADAGATVDFEPRFETAPVGNRDLEVAVRQLAFHAEGTGVLIVVARVNGRIVETFKVYMQGTEPTTAVNGDYWLDSSGALQIPITVPAVILSGPHPLRRRIAGAFVLIPQRGRSGGEEREIHLPVKTRGRTMTMDIRIDELIGLCSFGSWAMGFRPIKGRD